MGRALQSRELLRKICSFLNGLELSRLTSMNKFFAMVCSDDDIWRDLCQIFEFRPLRPVTRTSGRDQSWRDIYIANLCIECRGGGGIQSAATFSSMEQVNRTVAGTSLTGNSGESSCGGDHDRVDKRRIKDKKGKNDNQNAKGMVVIDVNGGSFTRMHGMEGPQSSLICLCSDCCAHVMAVRTWTQRSARCLPRAKKRLSHMTWSRLLVKIPFNGGTSGESGSKNKKTVRRGSAASGPREPSSNESGDAAGTVTPRRKQRRATPKAGMEGIESAHHNDYLLSSIGL